ncbi:MAG TPA: TldD/PmbA family protein [Longimicrobiales bacterium]
MSHSRREFLKAASAAAVSLAAGQVPWPGLFPGERPRGVLPGLDAYPHAGESDLRELAARALDAARAAGATYADVRFTLSRVEGIRFYGSTMYGVFRDYEYAGVGVRCLVDGAWGFASSTLWSADEVARLARESAAQARTNARGRRRKIELDPPPAPATGEWRTPIARDPFDVPVREKVEVAGAFIEHANRYNIGARNANVGAAMTTIWERKETTFASTDGAFISQTTYSAQPSFSVAVSTPKGRAGRSSDLLQPRAGGFEVVSEARLVDEIPRLVEDALLMAEAERITPDRYDVVVDARLMAQLVGLTIGTAAELDRVLGYEANGAGTSYLAPPAEMLGKFQLGSELLNVRANRSQPGGLATVRWDDEGVEPAEYDVIRDGVLVDYHTTRELAGALSEWYGAQGRPVRSHGCASSEDALGVTIVQPPNLHMLPGSDATTLDDLASTLKKGLVICAGRVTVDRQQLNGEINPEMVYEVRDGKRTKFLHSAEALFRAPELWKSLKAIGGAGTQLWSGVEVRKGQPLQVCRFGVGAVPGLFEKMAVTDRMRKA